MTTEEIIDEIISMTGGEREAIAYLLGQISANEDLINSARKALLCSPAKTLGEALEIRKLKRKSYE